MNKIFPIRSVRAVARTFTLIVAAACVSNLKAEQLTILHVGDQESWLLSAQGSLRDDASQALSFYGGVDRVATVLNQLEANAINAGRTVLRLNAGDAFLPGPRFNASLDNLQTAAADGGQDFYDSVAARALQFDAIVFGNHEFDFGIGTAARFADLSTTAAGPYLSFNLDFSQDPELAALATVNKVASHAIYQTDGGKNVAVIGLTTPLLPSVSSPQTAALMQGFRGFDSTASETANLNALVPELQALINDLRTNQSVSVVILLSHLQNASREIHDLIPLLNGVDLVVSGGGHELQTNGISSTIPTSSPVFGPALPNPAIPYPSIAVDASAKNVPVVTAHFGNRYVGQITLDIDDVTGLVTGFDASDSRVVRVSGRLADSDAVTGDTSLFNNVVTPVANYIAALNAEIVGTTDVLLNGERGVAGVPRNFTPGVRNAETNLGNLVADSLRFAAGADVSIQNAGGVRASIIGPNISVGATFNTLTFLNLVVVDQEVNASQLKAVLEHGFANSTVSGSAQGRFPQLSGLEVVFDTTRSAGDRVRRIILTLDPTTAADDLLLVDYGAVIDPVTTFSVATIDFLANGGDGYPFLANGFNFSNLVVTRNYQEALVDLIEIDAANGGLDGFVSSSQYPVVNPFSGNGRSSDQIYGTSGNDILTGTTGRDFITVGPGVDVVNSSLGRDTITLGAGVDTIIYTNLRHAGDIVRNYTPGEDLIDLSAFFSDVAVTPVLGSNIRFLDTTQGVSVQLFLNGRRTVLLTVEGVTAAEMNNASNFVL